MLVGRRTSTLGDLLRRPRPLVVGCAIGDNPFPGGIGESKLKMFLVKDLVLFFSAHRAPAIPIKFEGCIFSRLITKLYRNSRSIGGQANGRLFSGTRQAVSRAWTQMILI